MEALGLFALLLLGAVLFLPVAALVTASKAARRAERAEQEAKLARRELEDLRTWQNRGEGRIEALDSRLTAWVAHFQTQTISPTPESSPAPAPQPTPAAPTPEPVPTPTAAASPPAPDSPAPSASAVPPDSPAASAVAADSPAPSASTPTPPASPPPDPTRSRYRDTRSRHADPSSPQASPSPSAPTPPAALPIPTPFDWERLVGVRLFAWLGGGALFLAAALFLHYSIQQNLIAPPVRVAIGLAVGALSLFGGDRLRDKARLSGEALSGAGVAILYAALFAARALYGLIETPIAFAGMTLVTVTAGLIAVRRDAFFVALLGLLGGMATPYLLSTGEDRPLVLFAYVALLAAGIVLVARARGWTSLALIGLFCSMVVFVGWSVKYLVPERVPYALGAVALVTALFTFTRTDRGRTSLAAPAEDTGAPELSRQLQRLLSGIAALIPLATALALTAKTELSVDPRVLAGYLLVVSAGSFFAAERNTSAKLPVLAALLCVVTLAARVAPDLFPERRVLALASFAAVPAGFFVLWLARRAKPNEPTLRVAAVVALLGALPVTFLVAVTEPHGAPIAPILAYAWLHVLGLIAIGALRQQGFLFGAAQVLAITALSEFATDVSSRLLHFVLPAVASGLFFWALPLVGPRFRGDRAAWWSSAAALPLHFVLVYSFARGNWSGGALGAIACACAVLCALSLRGAQHHHRASKEQSVALSALFGGLTLAFVTAAVPLLLENEWLTISWAAEVAALAWLRRRVPHGGLIAAAALLASGVAIRLLANPALWEYHERTATPILNHYLYTFGAPALFFLLAARLLRPDELASQYRLPAALSLVAAVLLFTLMNVEIADFYSVGTSLSFRLSGGGLAEDMTYSLAWGAFAIGLLVVGMASKSRPTRIGALIVLVLTVGKVFLHDLWELGSLYRVGSIVGLAVALLGVSFLTQRFVLPKEER